MINAIIIGRGGSTGLPGKNLMKILGRPLMHYPILASLNSKKVNNIYLSSCKRYGSYGCKGLLTACGWYASN